MVDIPDSPLPVFYHVPKNAGTYVTNLSLLYFRGYRRTETDWNDYGYETIKNIELLNEHGTVARLLCGDPKNICIEDPVLQNNPHDKSHHTVSYLDTSKTCIKDLVLFQIIIEDAGFHLGDDILHQFSNSRTPEQWIILREPFSRSVSWYSYVTSSVSAHEPLHQYVTTSFVKYIESPIFESNWVMRKLVGVPDDQDFTEKDYKHAIAKLDKFNVYDITHVDEMVDEMFKSCYNIDRHSFPPSGEPPSRNQNPVKDKIKFEDLSKRIQEMYVEKTYWDRKLWKRYCK